MKKLKTLSMATVGAVVAAVGTLATAPAQAATFNFTGILNGGGYIYTSSTQTHDNSGFQNPEVTGSFTFDENATGTFDSNKNFMRYDQNPAIKFFF